MSSFATVIAVLFTTKLVASAHNANILIIPHEYSSFAGYTYNVVPITFGRHSWRFQFTPSYATMVFKQSDVPH